MPSRSASPRVCAKSRAVTSTRCPRCSSTPITGRRTTTCGEFVRSTQIRMRAPARGGHWRDRLERGILAAPASGYVPPMFTSQSLRAVVQPGALTVREQRLDSVVHQLEVRGTLDEETVGELARRVDAALAGGVRWLIVDLAGAVAVADAALAALVTAARELRSRKGELIVAGAAHDLAAPPAAPAPAPPPAPGPAVG